MKSAAEALTIKNEARRTLAWAAALAVLAAAASVLLTDRHEFIRHIVTVTLLFGALATAWNWPGGYAGQLSLGHAAFFAIGAYSVVILYMRYQVPPLLGGVVGMALAGAVAHLLGLTLSRLTGVFFTMATIAFGLIVNILLLHFVNFSGGPGGLTLPNSSGLITARILYYWAAVAFVTVTLLMTRLLERSYVGYSLLAIRGDQEAAESIGVQTSRLKTMILVASGVATALGGAIYAFYIQFIDPQSVAGLELSVEIAVMAIVGGRATMWGPLLGAVAIQAMNQLSNAVLGSEAGGQELLYGLLLILVIRLRPGGLISLFSRGRAA